MIDIDGDDPGPDATPTRVSGPAATRSQLRGGTLLLAGRTISLGINFVVQILIVRYLTETEYGAFAYALAFVNLAQTIVTFGLDRAITRFVPIYEEHGDYGRLFGTLILAGGAFVSLGLGAILVVIGLQDWLTGTVVADEAAMALLVILIFLAPINALDELIVGLFAVFANARAIFIRRYIFAPLARLLVVGLLVLTEQGVEFLAVGYVLTGAVILVFYGGVLVRFMRQRGLVERFDRAEVRIPAREVLAFTVPLLSSDLLYALMSTTDVILLGHFHSAADVGALRVILPAATLNQVIFSSFALLYTPAAARLFARDDVPGINDLYWRTAAWMAVLTFPIFLLTFSLAEPFTVLLFEERYRDSSVYLAILSLGLYFNVALGFNGLTLKVLGRIRYIVTLNLAAAVVNVALNLLLIPPLGALGAAIATGTTLIVHNVFKQAGLVLARVHVFDLRYVLVYGRIAVAAAAVLAIQVLVRPPVVVVVGLAAIATAAVFILNRSVLDITDTFPEVARIPVVGWLVRSRP
ncbi:MAG TPA: flippase [Candidatus Limnocylindria bacterium]|jgi:O-antigen/teichoic acid export membrane protein